MCGVFTLGEVETSSTVETSDMVLTMKLGYSLTIFRESDENGGDNKSWEIRISFQVKGWVVLMIFLVTRLEGIMMGVPKVEYPLREGVLEIPTKATITQIYFLIRNISSSLFITYTQSRKRGIPRDSSAETWKTRPQDHLPNVFFHSSYDLASTG